LEQPASVTVAFGASHTFMVAADPQCLDSHHNCKHEDKDHHEQHEDEHGATYQWLFNGAPLPGATSPILTVANVQWEQVGAYSVLVTQNGRTVESFAANLQINQTGNITQPVLAFDKLLDSFFNTNALRLGLPLRTETAAPLEAEAGGTGGSAPAIVRGFTSLQVFSTKGTTTDNNERPICGAIGGTSQRLKFTTEIDGLLEINTLGSLGENGAPLDTVIGLLDQDGSTGCTTCDACGNFTISILGRSYQFNCLACNDNAAPNASHSALSYPVKAGVTYYLAVDVVNRAAGTVRLSLCLQPTLSVAGLVQTSGPTGGGMELMINGDQFNTNATVRFGDQTILPTFQNETQILFPLPPGQGGHIQIQVTSGYCNETQISAPLLFHYGAPVIDQVTPAAGPSTGGIEMLITGQNFGTNASVFVGTAAAVILSQTHTQIRFLLPAGSGESQTIRVLVEDQSSDASQRFDYVDPRLAIALSDGAVRVSWDARLTGFVLQAGDTLDPEGWTDASSGSANPVLIPVTQARQFYRLRAAAP
ncbi:MAG TPA: IPT/TIG domain-containing protein, partial [Verrucomicrobiae bacterium]|nr:IPT/TIG domain-containing protein [Verrucomicrobiae bacterium]